MKDIKTRQGRTTFILSQDKSKLVEPPLSKRAGKQAIYYDFDVISKGNDGLAGSKHFIERRMENGEVVIYRGDPVEEGGTDYEQARREEEQRRLREAVMQVAHEDRLEDRLTTIILDFIAAIHHARAHRQRSAI